MPTRPLATAQRVWLGCARGHDNSRQRTAMRTLALSLTIAALAASPALAQSTDAWPSRPVRFVVPFPAGSSTDVIGRILAQMLSPRLGQQVVVDNRVGASGNIGMDAIARAAPDGYTFGFITTSTHAI